MPGIKELKTRIKSIQSTRKITRAMQMVSAAKMRRAQQAALNSRTYSGLVGELIKDLTPASVIPNDSEESLKLKISQNFHPEQSEGSIQALRDPSAPLDDALKSVGMTQLMKTYPQATKTGIIVISTNKGLVGGFNTNLMNKLREVENNPSLNPSPQKGREIEKNPSPLKERGRGEVAVVAELLVMGRKAKDYAVRFNKNMMADFAKSDTWTGIDSIYPLAKMVTELYQSGQYKKIVIIYNHFVSTLTQKATVKQLLPFNELPPSPSLEKREGDKAPETAQQTPSLLQREGRGELQTSDYLFEPDPTEVLEHLLPRIIESQIYQAVLESDASEHSARMVMMKNATEAAGDLISDLTLTYNQLRQNKITTELSEITAGRIALE